MAAGSFRGAIQTEPRFNAKRLEGEVCRLQAPDSAPQPVVQAFVTELVVRLQETAQCSHRCTGAPAVRGSRMLVQIPRRVDSKDIAPDQGLGGVTRDSLELEPPDLVTGCVVWSDQDRGAGMAVRGSELAADRALARALAADDQ